jgi:hypothetical protein
MGVEICFQTTFGSPAFNIGTQPSINLLFDHALPLGLSYEHNLGISGNQRSAPRERPPVQLPVVVAASGCQGL